jgi:tetratricopeptide (TPR) repeat protein
MKNAWISLAAVCVLVIGVYACLVRPGPWESLSPNAADSSYNLLVRGFRAGQLSLKKEVPPGFIRLTDPYNPTASKPYRSGPARLYDLSYYKGRLYLYFGVTPALILFWPFVALTGHYLSHRLAVLVFCTIGFLASVGVLYSAWKRYFCELSVWVLAACALALGLATVVPVILPRSDVYEVAISCGYMLAMLTLGAIWGALHKPERRCWWLAAASVAYGLGVGSRPTLLFGAIILLVPVIQAWCEGRRVWTLLIAAVAPIALIGSGVVLYNALRFDSPFEFGQHFQLAAVPSAAFQYFRPRFFWFNFRVYFLEPARWSARFPFVHKIAVPPLPVGYEQVEFPFGILTNVPLVWLATAVPLAWRGRSGRGASTLRWFAAAVAWLFVACGLPLGFFSSAIIRYEVDFAPALVLLAVVGLLGLERALAGQPAWRCAARWGWGALLSFSVAFNLLASVQCYAVGRWMLGVTLTEEGRASEAIQIFEEVLRVKPDLAEAHNGLGNVFLQEGKLSDAIEHYEQALQIKPDYAEAHVNMGTVFLQEGKLSDAIGHYEQALRINPDYAEAHSNLGLALSQAGNFAEGIRHCAQALRIEPDLAEAHVNFGMALMGLGKVPEAAEHFEQALRIKPDTSVAHYNLGCALYQMGRVQEAIKEFEADLRLKPDDAEAHYNLGVALEKLGRARDAITHHEEALRIKPDYADAQIALARLQARQ